MDYSITAKQLLEKVGGEKNIASLSHCMTRLRFVLKDESIVNVEEVEKIPGVMGTMRKGGQFQVIIGNNVAKCYGEIQKSANINETASDAEKPKQNVVNTALDFISSCMSPLVSPIISGGLLKVLLVILGPTLLNLLSTTSDTYIILNAIADSAFYFLPIFVAITASKKLGCNTHLAVMVSAMLLYPDLITLLGGEGSTYLFGFIPVIHGSYSSSVIPAMLAVILLKQVEKFVEKITPEWSKNFLKPLLIVVIVAPVTLCVLAPLGLVVGQGLQFALDSIYHFAPWLAMALFAGFMPFIVMTGMHWAFVPAALMALASPGYELMLLPAMLSSNIAQAGACFAVSLKTKDAKMRQVAIPAAISALLAGVTEPAMYGVTLRLKKPMYAACIASAIGGLVTGFVELKCYAFATPCATAIVQFVAPDAPMNIVYAIGIALLCFILAFIFTVILSKEKSDAEVSMETSHLDEKALTDDVDLTNGIVVETPVVGDVIPLSEVNDATFSSEVLGKGYAVLPITGEVYAPFDGVIETILDSHHAVGITSNDGVSMLVHVGLETVELNGQFFIPKVKEGDSFKKGDVLLTFDIASIQREGYDITTPVIITNSDDYTISLQEISLAKKGSQVLLLAKNI